MSIEQPSKDNNLSVRAGKPEYEHKRLVASAAAKLDAGFVTLALQQQQQQGGAMRLEIGRCGAKISWEHWAWGRIKSDMWQLWREANSSARL